MFHRISEYAENHIDHSRSIKSSAVFNISSFFGFESIFLKQVTGGNALNGQILPVRLLRGQKPYLIQQSQKPYSSRGQ